MHDSRSRSDVTTTQELSLWIAGALLTLAWFGFMSLMAARVESLDLGQRLFGLFEQSLPHDVLHLLLGVATLLTSDSDRICRRYLASTGTATLLLAVYGQVATRPVLPDLVPLSEADGVLHVLLGLTMVGAAVLPATPRRTSHRS